MDSLSRVDNAYPQIRGERPDLWRVHPQCDACRRIRRLRNRCSAPAADRTLHFGAGSRRRGTSTAIRRRRSTGRGRPRSTMGGAATRATSPIRSSPPNAVCPRTGRDAAAANPRNADLRGCVPSGGRGFRSWSTTALRGRVRGRCGSLRQTARGSASGVAGNGCGRSAVRRPDGGRQLMEIKEPPMSRPWVIRRSI